MTLKTLLAIGLALLATSAIAQSNQATAPGCSMQQLEPLLAEFVRAKAANNGSSAVAAADLASASADLSVSLEECGLKPSSPDSSAPPAPQVPDER
jgi:hypothetical protein